MYDMQISYCSGYSSLLEAVMPVCVYYSSQNNIIMASQWWRIMFLVSFVCSWPLKHTTKAYIFKWKVILSHIC